MTDDRDDQKASNVRGLAGPYRPDRHRGFDKAMENTDKSIERDKFTAQFKATYAPDPSELRRVQHADRVAAAAEEIKRDFPHVDLQNRPAVRLVAQEGIPINDRLTRQEAHAQEAARAKSISQTLAGMDAQTRREVHAAEHRMNVERMATKLSNMEPFDRHLTHQMEQRYREDNKRDDSGGNKL